MRSVFPSLLCFVLAACGNSGAISFSAMPTATAGTTQADTSSHSWQPGFDQQLRLFGHRNWIIIADSAFPDQNAAGIETIDTGEDMLPVLNYVLARMQADGHVHPIVYRDRELNFITDAQSPGIVRLSAETSAALKGLPVQTLLHESVFAKLDAESKLFKVLVLKTRSQHPYTSIFLQLDCAYWNADREAALRQAMAQKAPTTGQ